MINQKKILGNKGEQRALAHLKNKGYVLIGQNLRLFYGEIDLLMQDESCLVIVEVKYKSSGVYGTASDMITLKKKRKLVQLAKALSQKYPKNNIRIDVVSIDAGKIEHFISAVEEM